MAEGWNLGYIFTEPLVSSQQLLCQPLLQLRSIDHTLPFEEAAAQGAYKHDRVVMRLGRYHTNIIAGSTMSSYMIAVPPICSPNDHMDQMLLM